MSEIKRLDAEQLAHLEQLLAEQEAPVVSRFKPTAVSVHGTIPYAWVKVAMLGLNLLVWFDAVARLP